MIPKNDRDPANGDEGFELGRRLRTGRLEEILGFHMRMANVAIYQDYSAAMSELGLTQKQFAVLELIAANPGVGQIDIANQLSMDRATMMALVNRLEARHLIERQPSVIDRRRQELRMTGDGAAMLGKARQLQQEHELRFTSRFAPEELEILIASLKKIYADIVPDDEDNA